MADVEIRLASSGAKRVAHELEGKDSPTKKKLKSEAIQDCDPPHLKSQTETNEVEVETAAAPCPAIHSVFGVPLEEHLKEAIQKDVLEGNDDVDVAEGDWVDEDPDVFGHSNVSEPSTFMPIDNQEEPISKSNFTKALLLVKDKNSSGANGSMASEQ